MQLLKVVIITLIVIFVFGSGTLFAGSRWFVVHDFDIAHVPGVVLVRSFDFESMEERSQLLRFSSFTSLGQLVEAVRDPVAFLQAVNEVIICATDSSDPARFERV